MTAAAFLLGFALGFSAGVEFARYLSMVDQIGCVDE
jgi:hypothetical protein